MIEEESRKQEASSWSSGPLPGADFRHVSVNRKMVRLVRVAGCWFIRLDLVFGFHAHVLNILCSAPTF